MPWGHPSTACPLEMPIHRQVLRGTLRSAGLCLLRPRDHRSPLLPTAARSRKGTFGLLMLLPSGDRQTCPWASSGPKDSSKRPLESCHTREQGCVS